MSKVAQCVFKKFEYTIKLGIHPGIFYKPLLPVLVDVVKIAVVAQLQISEFRDSNARALSRQTGYSYRTIRNVRKNRIHYFLFKIHNTQELLDRDKPQSLSNVFNFLIKMTADVAWL